MRIVLVIDSFFPGEGGSERQVALLGKLLKVRGHEVRIVAPRLLRGLSDRDPLHETIDGLAVQRIDFPCVRGLGALVLSLRFMAMLWRLRGQTDVVHIHIANYLAPAAGVIAAWLPYPVFVKISGAWEFIGGILDAQRAPWSLSVLARRLTFRLHGLQAISAETVQRLRQVGAPNERILAIPNVVALPAPAQMAVPGAAHKPVLKVLYAGRLVSVKGVDVLMQAWTLLPDHRGIELHLVGDGRLEDALREQVQAAGVAASVVFHGWVGDVGPYLSDADLYVQPSRAEGLSNAVLEAMARGLPVVATRVSGNEDLVTDGVNGRLVPAENAPALAQALQQMLADRARLQVMGRAASDFVATHFGPEQVLTRLEALYEQGR